MYEKKQFVKRQMEILLKKQYLHILRKKHWISLHIAHVGPTIMMSRGHHRSWLVDFLGKTLLLFPDESLSDFVTGDFNQCKKII